MNGARSVVGVRRLGAALFAITAAIVFAEPLMACTVCMGAPDDPMTQGVSRGVWILLGIVFVVQALFVALFLTFWKRSRDLKKFRESLRVIEGGSR